MLRFAFRRGISFYEGLRVWTVIKRLPNGRIQLEDANSEVISLSLDEIHGKYTNGEFVVDPESLNDDGSSCHFVVSRDLSTYPEKEQHAAMRRQRYVSQLLKDGPIRISAHDLPEKIQKIAEEMKDANPPSLSSIYRWHRRFRNGENVTALVACNESKGRRLRCSGEVAEVLDAAIDEVYMNVQKNPRKAVVKRVSEMIDEMNKMPARLQKISAPSRSTIYRYLNSLYQYAVDTARAGKDLQMTKYRSVLGAVKVRRINERWEIDHTPIDLLVYCEKSMLPMGKPWLTVIIDRYSRMIMGFYISFRAPSADSVLQALVHAVLPKEEFLKKYPDIKGKWPACGLPEEIVSDNGMDLHSGSFRQACLELNMNLTFCAAKTPQQKGAIERFIKTINYSLIHRLPGTVFGNIRQRDEYESEKLSAIGFELLTHLVTKWIVEIYHQTRHRGLKDTPNNVWNKGTSERVIEYPASPEQLKVIAGGTKQRTLQHYGIELMGLKYNSVMLQDTRRHFGIDESTTLTVKYFESDAGYIYVFNPISKEYIKVNAVDTEYANGLHRAQHRMMLEHLRERGINPNDSERRREAERELQQLIEQSINSKKMQTRKKVAVLRGVNSNQPGGEIGPGKTKTGRIEKTEVEIDGGDDAIPSFEVVRHKVNAEESE